MTCFSGAILQGEEVNSAPDKEIVWKSQQLVGWKLYFLPDGFENSKVNAMFLRAKVSGSYDNVERWYGNGRANTKERAYALSNPMEYFAESSEAYFTRNDFFTFNAEELRGHAPAMSGLLSELWSVTTKTTSESD